MIIEQELNQKRDFVNAFVWLLSGCAKMKNAKEMWWEDEGEEITIEFPTLSPRRVIVRTYRSNGNKWTSLGYYDGWWHGKFLEWDNNGNLAFDVSWKKGKLHGKRLFFSYAGEKIIERYKNGERINEPDSKSY